MGVTTRGATGGQRGVGGGASNAAAIFQFFQENIACLCIFWSKFLLRNVFLNDYTHSVVDASSFLKACAENTVTPFPKKKKNYKIIITHVGLTFCLKTFFK